jgi:hypothetical protein
MAFHGRASSAKRTESFCFLFQKEALFFLETNPIAIATAKTKAFVRLD